MPLSSLPLMAVSTKAQTHGASAYKRGCRCDVCKAAKKADNARYTAKRFADPENAIDHYQFHVTCLDCGSPVAHMADGVPTEGGSRAQAVCQCTSNCCGKTWLVTAIARPFMEENGVR